tara:strand:+ start:2478 stop:3308 length:831 start_codon:yes stop_codon:yes gene_type:complete
MRWTLDLVTTVLVLNVVLQLAFANSVVESVVKYETFVESHSGNDTVVAMTGSTLAIGAAVKSIACCYPALPPDGTLLSDCKEWHQCVASKGLQCMDSQTGKLGTSLVIMPFAPAGPWDPSHRVAGPIPAADLAEMTGLTVLSLRGNALTRPIPDEIGLLTNLGVLWLDANKLGGPIPTEIGSLTNLQTLFLNNNQLTGPIPSEIGLLTALSMLSLNDNNFTGAGTGICKIEGQFNSNCDLSPNSEWTDGALCPACLNDGQCVPPIRCTGANPPTPS